MPKKAKFKLLACPKCAKKVYVEESITTASCVCPKCHIKMLKKE